MALKVIKRDDYCASYFKVPQIVLLVQLDTALTSEGKRECKIVSTLTLLGTPGSAGKDLVLNAEALELTRLELNGVLLVPGEGFVYDAEAELLTVFAASLPSSSPTNQGPSFTLTSHVTCCPELNTQLQGLFCSSGVFCTQMEAEGFRRMAPCLDRPDVLSTYRVRLEALKEACPILLSNGNLIDSGDLASGAAGGAPRRHFAVFEDPHPKPTYLFAVVAGPLWRLSDKHTTMGGREVQLHVYVDGGPHRVAELGLAMASLKRAMAWDEREFGREYDLEVFNVVAVADFNMGAMENKGLNVFNSKYVVAHPHTTSDAAMRRVEGIIAHEYFHNWTGNRVTCRDWFQLTLKEGLTVFRDQEFTAAQYARSNKPLSSKRKSAVKRIADVATVRQGQFSEDSGPLAHPIRPEQYVKMDNFYTRTVYRKGAEVVRMYKTLLGSRGFRKGADLYFARHDGQAVTCEDFRRAMADANDETMMTTTTMTRSGAVSVAVAVGGPEADGLEGSAATPAVAAAAVGGPDDADAADDDDDGGLDGGVAGASELLRSAAFGLWYSQAGTPTLTVEAASLMKFKLNVLHTSADSAAAAVAVPTHVYRLVLSQATAPTPGQPHKAPLLLPVALGLVNRPPPTVNSADGGGSGGSGSAPNKPRRDLKIALLRSRDLEGDGFAVKSQKPAGAAALKLNESSYKETVVVPFSSARAEFLFAVRAVPPDEDHALEAEAEQCEEVLDPVLSVLRDWSCPVKLNFPSQAPLDLSCLMRHDGSAFDGGFSKHDAHTRLATHALVALANQHRRRQIASADTATSSNLAVAVAAVAVSPAQAAANALADDLEGKATGLATTREGLCLQADEACAAVVEAFVEAWQACAQEIGAGLRSAESDQGLGEEQHGDDPHLQALLLSLPSDAEVLNSQGITASGLPLTAPTTPTQSSSSQSPSSAKEEEAVDEVVLDAAAVREARETLHRSLLCAFPFSFEAAYHSARGRESKVSAEHLTTEAEGGRALSLALLECWVRSVVSDTSSADSAAADSAADSAAVAANGGEEGGAAAVATAAAAMAALWKHFNEATNMTDRAGALKLCAGLDERFTVREVEGAEEAKSLQRLALSSFEATHSEHREAIDEWFTAQATSSLPNSRGRLEALMKHPRFSVANPNKVRAVFGCLGAFAPCVLQDPSVLALVGEVTCLVDESNPNQAANLAKMLAQWRRFPAGPVRGAAKAALLKMAAREGCSKNVGEVVGLALANKE